MRISLSPIDQVIIVGYFLVVIAIGLLSTRRKPNALEFLLAGRTLTLPVFVMTLVSSWYGGILGVGEFSYLYGFSNWIIQGFPYYFFAALFAFILAEKVRRTDLLTIPDKLEDAYGRKTAVLGSFLTFLLMVPAPYVLMLAVLLQLLTGWALSTCLIVGTVASTIYLFSGGFRSDVNTDIFEFFFMFLGFGLILPFAYFKFGGIEFIKSHVPPAHMTWNGGNSTQFVLIWFFIALWTFVDPTFHQRCYAAKSGRTARWGILVSILFWFVFDAMTTFAGLYARAALPNLTQPMMSYPLLAEQTLPSVAKGFFYIGMLATIMSTFNTQAFVSATTLGRDVFLRLRGDMGGNSVRATRWGLLITGVGSMALAWYIPSVVRLWYTIGTVIVPGLLVPLVSSYFARTRIPSSYAFVAMLSGWLVSLGWLLFGKGFPLEIEPMYPGLFVSLAVWAVGWLRLRSDERRSATSQCGGT
ncbi:MAG: sodium:solute symporter family protein [Pseudomonadota bacterium]